MPRPPPCPFRTRPRRFTSAVPALMTMPFAPDTRMPASPAPSLVMLIALLIVRLPYAPESTTLISPPGDVAANAVAKVAQGAARLHGLVSRPVPETQVRDACAPAGDDNKTSPSKTSETFLICRSPDRSVNRARPQVKPTEPSLA